MQTGRRASSEWHALDHVNISESHAPVPKTAMPWDWFHLELDRPRANGNLLISGRSTWPPISCRPERWHSVAAGGWQQQLQDGSGYGNGLAHDARMTPDGTGTFFDNGSSPRFHYQSRGVRVAIDSVRHIATLVRDDTHRARCRPTARAT